MTVADELRRLKMKKSAEQQARERRAAKRNAKGLESRLKNNRAPGSMHDKGFLSQLDRKAREARERAGEKPRPDLDEAIAAARQKGQLPPAHDAKTGYVPTVEEILGDDALPKSPAPSGEDTEDLPSADDVLNTPHQDEPGTFEANGYKAGPLSVDELKEVERLNRKGMAQSSQGRHHQKGRHRGR